MKRSILSFLVGFFFLPHFLLSQTFSISGQITRHNGDPIEGIELPWFGMSTTTDANGIYEFTNVPIGGSFELAPIGQFDEFDDVTILDMIELRRHILQISLFNFIPLLESDINNSTTVTTLDLIRMQQLALKLPASINNSWGFCTMTPNCPLAIITPMADDNLVLDFVGIKRGDPVISADYQPAPPEAPSPVFATSVANFQAGDEVEIKITVADFKNIVGLQNTFTWDPSLLNFQFISTSTALQLESNLTMVSDGVIGVTGFNLNADNFSLPDGEVLFTLKFNALGNAPNLGVYVDITNDLIPIQIVWENPADNKLFLIEGDYTIGEIPTSIDDLIIDLYEFKVFPNPVNDLLKVKASFEEAQPFEVIVIDILGRSVFSKKYNQDILDIGIDMSAFSSGNYFLSLKSAKGIQSELIFKR